MLVCIESNSTAQEEFEELCFSFGIELDDVVSACISFSFWLLILKCLISLFKIFFFFFWRLLRKQLCGRKSIWMKNLTAMKKLSTKLKSLLIGILLFNIKNKEIFNSYIYIYACIYMVFCLFGKNQVKVALYYLLIEN